MKRLGPAFQCALHAPQRPIAVPRFASPESMLPKGRACRFASGAMARDSRQARATCGMCAYLRCRRAGMRKTRRAALQGLCCRLPLLRNGVLGKGLVVMVIKSA